MGKKLTYEYVKEFIENENYTLLSNDYINASKHLQIKCDKEHTYSASFDRFQQGRRCPICRAEEKGDRGRKITTEDVIKHFKDFGFDAKLTKYINPREKFEVVCKNGHSFVTSLYLFKKAKKQSCKECLNNMYMARLKEILAEHGYEMISNEYVNTAHKLEIKCDKGHIYNMSPDSIKSGSRCPVCNISKGEEAIENFLINNNFSFKRQHVLKGCRYKWALRFDFYVPDLNLLIEYDGIQHFEDVAFDGKKSNLKSIQKRDTIKNDYCKKNNLPLLRIHYKDFDNINVILSKAIKDFKLKENLND